MVDYERAKIPYPIRLAVGDRFCPDHAFGGKWDVSGRSYGYD